MVSTHEFSTVAMDTWVRIQVVTPRPGPRLAETVEQAFEWFRVVERVCSRFEPESEVCRLAETIGRRVPVSRLLLEATAYALELARVTDGAFDPTVGGRLERAGFNRSYRTGLQITTPVPDRAVSYRDVRIDRRSSSITLSAPIVLDLGAVAKGLALDLAGRALRSYPGFSIDAGGDLLVQGRNAEGNPWRVGIQNPAGAEATVRTVSLTEGGICTSGGYERRVADGGIHAIDARSGGPPDDRIASVSVIAPTAMAADGLSTAAWLLGSEAGPTLLERQRVSGLFVLVDGTQLTTRGKFEEDR
jgi:thiamine biosynthesis lipoprotein